jgi:cellulose synthase/poly-beta-1,6-N-acetylglucosamine synthase-like glycosyltransferase
VPDPAEPRPGLSVVVPVRDGAVTLPSCLAAVFASQAVPPLEVIVVDDCSRDGSAAVAERFPCRVVRLEHGRGPSVARNRGAREARGDVLVFVDADVLVAPDTLARLSAALDDAPAAFATYAREPRHGNFATVLYHTLSLRSLRDTGERVPVLYSYCLAMRADVFRETGGFDPAFSRATFEDAELGWRLARTRGLSRHVRDAPVVHAVRYGLAGLARAYFRKSRDLALLLLSSGVVSLGDQGWTRRRNWLGLVSAWTTLLLAIPALAGSAVWALAWAGAFAVLLLLGGGEVALALGRRRWLWAPLGVAAFVAIHVVATAAMVTAGLAWTSARLRLTGGGVRAA